MKKPREYSNKNSMFEDDFPGSALRRCGSDTEIDSQRRQGKTEDEEILYIKDIRPMIVIQTDTRMEKPDADLQQIK